MTALQDEARQEARLALWSCAKRYRFGFPVSLRQYASHRILGRIKDMVRSMAGRQGHHKKLLQDKRITDNEGSRDDRFVVVPDEQLEPLDLLIQRETIDQLYAQMDSRGRLILDSLAGLRTQREVADHCKVTEGRVSQLVSAMVTRLRGRCSDGCSTSRGSVVCH